jgi:hypothetical protein
MKIINTGEMPDGTHIRIEDWHDTYEFMPSASKVASYPLSKVSKDGIYAPRAGEEYRFSFSFENAIGALAAFNALLDGSKKLSDFIANIDNKKYADCV